MSKGFVYIDLPTSSIHFKIMLFVYISIFPYRCCSSSPVSIYLFKVNNRNTTKKCEICSKLTIKRPQQCLWRRSGVFIISFEKTYFTVFSSVFVVDFEQVNVSWYSTRKDQTEGEHQRCINSSMTEVPIYI